MEDGEATYVMNRTGADRIVSVLVLHPRPLPTVPPYPYLV
jgi:hypothetical protein